MFAALFTSVNCRACAALKRERGKNFFEGGGGEGKNWKKQTKKRKKKKMVIADAIPFVRKQISRARGSIQDAAVFI